MGFAASLNGWVPAVTGDASYQGGAGVASYQGGSFRMLGFHTLSSRPFSQSKPRICLQISSRLIKHGVSASSSVESSDENYAASGKFTSKEASFDIKLPRRNMIVQFTCNSCGERTERRISRAAYERGTVFVQCAGCLVNHKLVDNLGLVIEYDLREDLDAGSNGAP